MQMQCASAFYDNVGNGASIYIVLSAPFPQSNIATLLLQYPAQGVLRDMMFGQQVTHRPSPQRVVLVEKDRPVK
jgi:hypothetical protein